MSYSPGFLSCPQSAALSAPRAKMLRSVATWRRTAGKPALPTELGGREGPEPVRYGDWEKKGLAVDF